MQERGGRYCGGRLPHEELVFQMPLILFQCPVKALKVEWVDCEGRPQDGDGALYKVIVCPACARLHFVNHAGELKEER